MAHAASDSPLFILFARAPLPGRAKTRLAKALGTDAAAEFAELSLDIISTRLRVSGATWYLAPPAEEDRQWFVHNRPQIPLGDNQVEGDLGLRMVVAMRKGLQHSKAAVVIGSDIPDARLDDVEQLVNAELGTVSAQMWIGPTVDGGFWTLGADKAPPLDLLSGVDWSSGREYIQTVERFASTGYAVHVLEEGDDVDTAVDLVRLTERLQAYSGAKGEEALNWREVLKVYLRKAASQR